MVQSNKYQKSRTVGFTSKVGLTTDRDVMSEVGLTTDWDVMSEVGLTTDQDVMSEVGFTSNQGLTTGRTLVLKKYVFYTSSIPEVMVRATIQQKWTKGFYLDFIYNSKASTGHRNLLMLWFGDEAP